MGESHFLQGKTEIVGKVDVKMNCNIIKDLLPLYVDGCCCEESAKVIEEHIKNCEECGKYLESIKKPIEMKATVSTPMKAVRISEWKASAVFGICGDNSRCHSRSGDTVGRRQRFLGGNAHCSLDGVSPFVGKLVFCAIL